MLCLGIESSCDDTGLALVKDGQVLDEILASQARAHAIFGGVVPELASREHGRHIGLLFDELLKRNKIAPGEIDVIAVARGPGLLGSLLVGMAFAKGLALTLRKPLIGVNHLHAHLLACGIEKPMKFPCLGLVVSGGHTELHYLESPWQMRRLGRTLDDAAGEVFDKAGSAIGLSYPAGKAIADLAQTGNPAAYNLPLPYLHNDNMDFSFSGLKTAAITLAAQLRLNESGRQRETRDFCASLNAAIARTIAEKCKRALAAFPAIDTLAAAGGVAANDMLAKELEKLMRERGGHLLRPPVKWCMDNGVMIANAGEILTKAGFFHDASLEAIPRGQKIPDDMLRKQKKPA